MKCVCVCVLVCVCMLVCVCVCVYFVCVWPLPFQEDHIHQLVLCHRIALINRQIKGYPPQGPRLHTRVVLNIDTNSYSSCYQLCYKHKAHIRSTGLKIAGGIGHMIGRSAVIDEHWYSRSSFSMVTGTTFELYKYLLQDVIVQCSTNCVSCVRLPICLQLTPAWKDEPTSELLANIEHSLSGMCDHKVSRLSQLTTF